MSTTSAKTSYIECKCIRKTSTTIHGLFSQSYLYRFLHRMTVRLFLKSISEFLQYSYCIRWARYTSWYVQRYTDNCKTPPLLFFTPHTQSLEIKTLSNHHAPATKEHLVHRQTPSVWFITRPALVRNRVASDGRKSIVPMPFERVFACF
jgi:hypothetical protein